MKTKPDRHTGREVASKDPANAEQPEKQKRSLKDRWLTFREDFAGWKKKMKEGPTKAEIAAKEKAKVDRLRGRIDSKAKKDAKKRERQRNRYRKRHPAPSRSV